MKKSKSNLIKVCFPKVQRNIEKHNTLNSKEIYSNIFRKECSKLCHHLSPKQVSIIDRSKIKILNIQIENNKLSLHEWKKHFLKLTEENEMLKNVILQLEDNMFVDGSSILQEHDKYSSFHSLNIKKYSELLLNEQHQFELFNKKLTAELDKFTSDIKKLQGKIDEGRLFCEKLKQFKHAEFEENEEKIKYLNYQVPTIKNTTQKEYESFQRSHEKRNLLVKSRKKLNNDRVKAGFCQLVCSSMTPDVMRMARENIVIKKEIDIQKNETDLLSCDIAMLEQRVQDLP